MTDRPRLIETLRVEPGGDLPLLEGHLARLQASALALGYGVDIAAVRTLLLQRAAGLDAHQSWRLRLLLACDGHCTLEHGPLHTPPDPLRVVVTGPRQGKARNWLQHKTTFRPWYESATDWLAQHPDIFDVLYWDEDGMMCEGSRSTIYVQADDGSWLTPPLSAGVLPGVQRAALLQSGRVREAPFSRDTFRRATRRRISNALRGWRDIQIVDTPTLPD